MGGQIVRAYITDLGANGLEVINRGVNWTPAYFNRLNPQDTRYRRDDNFWAGSIRRFITLGSPFKGSPIANAVQASLRANQSQLTLLALGSRNRRMRQSGFYKLLYDANGAYVLPTAIADLCEGSAVQTMLESASRYPQGRRRVPWCPIVGLASNPNGSSPTASGWSLLLVKAGGKTVPSLSAANSDLVVTQWSQRNADDALDYPNALLSTPGFDRHVHTFENNLAPGFRSETFSVELSNEAAVLLSGPASAMLLGDLH